MPCYYQPGLVGACFTLIVGDLGRTELAVSAEKGAKDMFQSIQKLKALPDYIQVFPGPSQAQYADAG